LALVDEFDFNLGARLRTRLGRRPRLLVAEDDDELRWALVGALTKRAFLVHQVTSGSDLLGRFIGAPTSQNDAPDLVISDVRMPGCSGLNAIRCLRAAYWATPVVFMSAFDAGVDFLHGIDVATLMRKPIAVRDLVAVVELMIWTGRSPRAEL
jgi:DNA-binding response OmpR family regulator